MIKIQIKTVSGKVIFEYEKDNNTIKDTLLEALKTGGGLTRADLTWADLRGADLRGADLKWSALRGADLRGSNLKWANLTEADLRGVDLRGVDLKWAHLTEADLRGSDLRGADLRGANLRGAENKKLAKLPIYCKWQVSIKGEKINIGCKSKTIEDWDKWFDSNKEYDTPRDTEEFKQIEGVYLAYRSYYQHLKK